MHLALFLKLREAEAIFFLFRKVLNVVSEQFTLLRTLKIMNISTVASGRSPTWLGTISPTLNAKKTTNISILAPGRSSTWSVNNISIVFHFSGRSSMWSMNENFPSFEREKTDYFKLLDLVVEEQQFPQLQTLKNYEYFKLLAVVGEQRFPPLQTLKTTNILIVAS